MRLLTFHYEGRRSIGVLRGDHVVDLGRCGATPAESMIDLIATGAEGMAAAGAAADSAGAEAFLPLTDIEFAPPVPAPGKCLCVGLNYADHAAEAKAKAPDYPVIFTRYATSLCGHEAPLVRPRASDKFDYEGEMAVIIGKEGRHIAEADALDHVAGYSIFNDGSVRDFQMRTSQWTLGKNFDSTGGFGPCLVTADSLPPGAHGLRLTTRVNDEILQDANTEDMIFPVASLIAILSEVMTLVPGDVIVTGTPSGVGFARDPKRWLRPGDRCEIEIEGLGRLRNRVVDENSR